MKVLHTRIELVVDVIRGTWAPGWLISSSMDLGLQRFLTIMMQKLPQHLLRTSFHYHPVENWVNGELQGFTQFGTMLMLHMYVKAVHNLFSHG